LPLHLPSAADVLQHFADVHGICMQSLSPFNEPASPALCLQLNNRKEGCYFSKPRSHKVTQRCLTGLTAFDVLQLPAHAAPVPDRRKVPFLRWHF
jgi:hypothetical protein